MKKMYIFAILAVLLLVVGCKPAVKEEAKQEVVAEEPVVQAAEEPVVTTPDTAVAQAKAELSYEEVDTTVQRLIDTCKAGNVGVCTTLKTKYNIDVNAESAAEEEAPATE